MGIYPNEGVRWNSFYDIDDLLAFPVRDLFSPNDGIVDVNTGDRTDTAHGAYWKESRVLTEVANLLASTMMPAT
jgi:hypothetical protein